MFTQYKVQGDVGSDLPGHHQTTKVTPTEGSPERSGYMHIVKQVTHSILIMLFFTRGTKIAKVEGLWLVYGPGNPDDSLEVWLCSPFIIPSLNSMRDPHDVMIVCSDLPAGKPMHMHIGTATICASTSIHARTPNTTKASEPLCLFLNPILVPVTLSPSYFGAPSYWSPNLFTYSQQNTGKNYKQTRMMDATYQLTNTIK